MKVRDSCLTLWALLLGKRTVGIRWLKKVMMGGLAWGLTRGLEWFLHFSVGHPSYPCVSECACVLWLEFLWQG